MSDPFLAEIRIFPFSFAPNGWAFCNGQLLPISQNTALFALLGTFYGGDGKSTFALPDLKGRIPLQPGIGQGQSPHELGEMGGAETVTLLPSEMPVHLHTMSALPETATVQAPAAGRAIARSQNTSAYQNNTTQALEAMASETLALTGGSFPHNNLQPYLTLNFCIALFGEFPARW